MKLRTTFKIWAERIKIRRRKADEVEPDQNQRLENEAARKGSELGPAVPVQASKTTTAPPEPVVQILLVERQEELLLLPTQSGKAEVKDKQVGKTETASKNCDLEIEAPANEVHTTETAERRPSLFEVSTQADEEKEPETSAESKELEPEKTDSSPTESTSSSLTIRPSASHQAHSSPPSSPSTPTFPVKPLQSTFNMPGQPTESDLHNLLSHLHSVLNSDPSKTPPNETSQLLSKAKLALLHLNALLPSQNTSPSLLALARETLEIGALLSIRLRDAEGFVRYFQQVQPFYVVPEERAGGGNPSGPGSNRSKITGLYLLLLLSQQNYLGFHMVLEGLELLASAQEGSKMVDDEFIRYPVRLERALMEGSYDRVWGEITGNKIPGPEFALFSSVLIDTIRSEIASCSEKAYPSIPLSNAKNLFFLESEGAVLTFAKAREGWTVKDGRIYFPVWSDGADSEAITVNGVHGGHEKEDVLSASGTVIENVVGYARELETIV